MRIAVAAFRAWFGIFAVLWATVAIAATGAGTSASAPSSAVPGVTAAKVPSIQILQSQSGLAGTCGGSPFNLNTFINVGSQASADVQLTAPGAGILEEFTDEMGKNIGPYAAKYSTFHIPAFGGGLAPNTIITVTITTYSGPALTGSKIFTSTLAFDCTTGAIFRAPASLAEPIPTLSETALLATMVMLALFGAILLRRPSPLRRKR